MPIVTYGQGGVTYGQAQVEYGEPGFSPYPTAEFWTVDGYSLQTYAYNIATWGGSRQSPPPLRGEDLLIPHRVGRAWVPKVADSKTMTMGMWVIGATDAGTVPTDGTGRRVFEKNWRLLKRLLWTPNRQIELTKRFYDDADALVYATALAQYAGGLEPEMTGRTRAAFTVDLKLADPFFYGRPQTISLTAGTSVSVPALGDAETIKTIVTLSGPLTTPQIMLSSNPSVGFTYNGTLGSGETLVVDIENFKATKYTASGSTKAVGLITNSGASYYWLPIGPLPSSMLLSAASGAGTASIVTQAAWH